MSKKNFHARKSNSADQWVLFDAINGYRVIFCPEHKRVSLTKFQVEKENLDDQLDELSERARIALFPDDLAVKFWDATKGEVLPTTLRIMQDLLVSLMYQQIQDRRTGQEDIEIAAERLGATIRVVNRPEKPGSSHGTTTAINKA